MIRNLFFDLDDTLLDFHRAEDIALRRTLSSLGTEPTDEIAARYSEINDRQWKMLERGERTREQVKLQRFQILLEEFGIPASAGEARDRYEENLSRGYYFMEGALPLLKELAPSFRLYLASNGTARVQHGRLESAGIEPYFQGIFISEEIGYDKPDVRFFEKCFEKIPSFSREETLMVGDSLTSDIRGGRAAGIRTCWYNPRGEENPTEEVPDFEIRELAQLPALLSEFGQEECF